MLNEKLWGVDVDEESGLVYGPFKHAFNQICFRLGMLMLTLLMLREVEPMGFVINYCLRLGL